MNIDRSFQILEALYSLQKENLTKEKFNEKYPNIKYEKILSLKEIIEKDKILKKKIIKFHNEGILVDFVEKVNLEKLPNYFSFSDGIHNKKHFDILNEIKDYELFFKVHNSIIFLDSNIIVQLINENSEKEISTNAILRYLQIQNETKYESLTIVNFSKIIGQDNIMKMDKDQKFFYLKELVNLIKKFYDENRYYDKFSIIKQKINLFFIDTIFNEKLKEEINNFINNIEFNIVNSLTKRRTKINKEIEEIKKKDKENNKLRNKEDEQLGTLINQKLDKFFNQSKLNKERTIQSIEYLFNNQIKDDNLREKFLELDYEILKIILNPDFYFNYLNKSIIEKFLSISKEDILTKVFSDPNNRKKENIISYVNELWIKEIKPDIDDEKLNILKNYEYLYTLKDFLREIIDFKLEKLENLFYKKFSFYFNYINIFNDINLLKYHILELENKNKINFNTLKEIAKIDKDSRFNFELKKKILYNLQKNLEEVDLLNELIQFPGLADKFLDLYKDLIAKRNLENIENKDLKNNEDDDSLEILVFDLITMINNEQKDPLDIFMKKYYLLDLLLSSKELLESAYKEYKKSKVEYCKQLSNISDLLIDFQPNNQELLNALRKFLPNLPEDEFNKCGSVDKLIQLISEPNQEFEIENSNAVNPNSPKL